MKPNFLCVALFVASPAFSQGLPADVRACRFINTDAARLACFDKATDPAAQPADPAGISAEEPTVEAAAPTAPVSKWSYSQEKSTMTDQMSRFLSLRSTGYVQCSQFGNPGPLTLWARALHGGHDGTCHRR